MQVLEHEPQPQWQLSDNQWGKVKASPYFDRYPGAKLLPRRAIFQTLQSSYKRGYMVYSQVRTHAEGSPGRCGIVWA